MASMGFSYAQIHVRQEKVRQRIVNQQEAANKTAVKNKNVCEENKISNSKKNSGSLTAAGRVHPCASPSAAAAAAAGPTPERNLWISSTFNDQQANMLQPQLSDSSKPPT
ncbi:hypothetical protein ZWY2020_037501 [Hordeum vulgare]|nr:hypothetical protein ZWY2020_037501 [Hordeum vulgare]